MTFSANAQQVVGSFTNSYWGKEFKIEASQKDGKLEYVYIGVEAKGSKTAFISVPGKNLELFKTSLELARDKYLEWVKIAKENNVTEMNKELGIKFPSVNVAWYGTKWWFSFGRIIDMEFLILNNGKMIASWLSKVSSSANQYIDETIYFIFADEADFNNLISQLEYQGILDQLLNTEKKQDLFH